MFTQWNNMTARRPCYSPSSLKNIGFLGRLEKQQSLFPPFLQFLCDLCGNPAAPIHQPYLASQDLTSETRSHSDVPLTRSSPWTLPNHRHSNAQLFPPLHQSYGIDPTIPTAYLYLHEFEKN